MKGNHRPLAAWTALGSGVAAALAALVLSGCGDDYDVCIDGSRPTEICTERCREADGGLSFCADFPFGPGDDDDDDVAGDDDDDVGDDDDDDMVVGLSDVCVPCETTVDCRDTATRCVEMTFDGEERSGGYCLRVFDPRAGGCPAPYQLVLTDRVVLGDRDFPDAGPGDSDAGVPDAGPPSAPLRFCGLDERTTTCEAVVAFLGSQDCEVDDDCGVPGLDDGWCREVDGEPDRCTYPCELTEQCPGRCPATGWCGGPVDACPELAMGDGEGEPPDAGPLDGSVPGDPSPDCRPETEDEDCGGTSCDPVEEVCTDTPRGSVDTCGSCIADSECTSGHACVPMFFGSCDRPTGYCLRPGPVCERPFSVVTGERVSLSGGPPNQYCGINESLTTCEAVLDLTQESSCAIDADCGVPVLRDALCTFVNGDADRCTYPCSAADECDSALRACAGDPAPYCGGF